MARKNTRYIYADTKQFTDMTIVHNIATFILAKLYEKGRNIKKSDLSKNLSTDYSVLFC